MLTEKIRGPLGCVESEAPEAGASSSKESAQASMYVVPLSYVAEGRYCSF